MADNVVIKKGSTKRMRASGTSPWRAKRLSKAIKSLQNFSIEELMQKGVVKKLNVSGRNDVYIYRVGLRERIIFSPVSGKNLIHDIVACDNTGKVKSLFITQKKSK